jgi:fructose-bisphosphate aldolase class II
MLTIKEIIKKAREEKFAVGAFNTSNLEVTQAIARAAEAQKAPAMISVTESALEYAGFNTLIKLVQSIIEESKSPLVFHLDHGKSYEICKKCVDAGFKSVMIDGSILPFEKNVELTKSVVDYAHTKEVFVQAELGKIPRVSDENKGGKVDVKIGEMEKTVP